jgi:hypothetical protein
MRRRDRVEPQTTNQRFKEDLRRRCVVRAAAQRADLVARHRGGSVAAAAAAAAQDIIRAELAAWSASPPDSGGAWREEDEVQLQATLGRDAYLDLMAATEEQLLRELGGEVLREVDGGCSCSSLVAGGSGGGSGCYGGGGSGADDEAVAHEYEAYLRAEEEAAAAAAADADADAVPCPLCVSAPLQLGADGCIECSLAPLGGCALRIDARGHAAPLRLLRERMCALLEEHQARCPAVASCRLPCTPAEAQLGVLLFGCGTCGLCTGVV